ncbi:MAG: DciA family protein [Desulfocapsaceae bacterium]
MRKRTYSYGDPSLKATFAGIIRDKDWEKKFDQHRVFTKWPELVDQETAKYARPLKIVNDVLWLEVDNSAWVQQFQFKKLELLEILNDYLRVAYFADIRFTVGESTEPEQKIENLGPRMVPPTSEEIEQFEKQIEFIEDEEIRKAMTRLWYVSKAVRRE